MGRASIADRDAVLPHLGRARIDAGLGVSHDRDADLALIMAAIERAELRSRPEIAAPQSAPQGLTSLIIEFDGGGIEVLHETGTSPPSPKSEELAQLEEILDRLSLVSPAFSFDELLYREKHFISGQEQSFELSLNRSREAILKTSEAGRLKSAERVTLLPDQLEELDRFLGQTNPFLTTFAPFVPSQGATESRIELSKAGQRNGWTYSEPRDLSLDAQRRLHSVLARLLDEGLQAEGFRDLSSLREDRATRVGRTVRVTGDRLDFELSVRSQFVHGDSRPLSLAERQVLQAAYQAADLALLPGRLPESAATLSPTTILSLREGSIHRSIQGSNRSIEPAGYKALREALEALIASWNPDLFELRGVVRVSSRRTDIVPEYERLEVAGPLKSALGAFKDREVVVQARLDSKGRILVTQIYGQPEVRAEGILRLNGSSLELLDDSGAPRYRLDGVLLDSLRPLAGRRLRVLGDEHPGGLLLVHTLASPRPVVLTGPLERSGNELRISSEGVLYALRGAPANAATLLGREVRVRGLLDILKKPVELEVEELRPVPAASPGSTNPGISSPGATGRLGEER